MAVQKFDRSVLKVGQVFIMGINVLAFALGFVLQVRLAWLLAPLVGIVMLVGVINPDLGLFRQLYLRFLKPRGVVQARVVEEDPAPHQFAQVVGAVFLLGAGAAFALGGTGLGWGLTWIVILLAFINFAFDFCVGCQVYFQLQRLRLIPNRG
ncbi:MAG TPA: DUF4395 domain-containing protein [Candidatus Dormibacteraeota bacterium]|nr:DUF4395 domain-containing protein [Candidatus Dormibacteraeota bacterium]